MGRSLGFEGSAIFTINLLYFPWESSPRDPSFDSPLCNNWQNGQLFGRTKSLVDTSLDTSHRLLSMSLRDLLYRRQFLGRGRRTKAPSGDHSSLLLLRERSEAETREKSSISGAVVAVNLFLVNLCSGNGRSCGQKPAGYRVED